MGCRGREVVLAVLSGLLRVEQLARRLARRRAQQPSSRLASVVPSEPVVFPEEVGSMLPGDKRPPPAAWSATWIRASGPTTS